METNIRRLDTTKARTRSFPDVQEMESQMIADRANDQGSPSGIKIDRRLRNLILLGNVLAWLVIIVAIRMLVF